MNDHTVRNLIIALVEDHPKAILLMRMARRRAQERGGVWRAVYIETPAQRKSGDSGAQERMLHLLTAAEQMGGESEHFEAPDIEKGLELLCSRERERLHLILIGNKETDRSFPWFRTMLWARAAHTANQYAQVEIVPLSGQAYRRSFAEIMQWHNLKPHYFFYALVAIGIAFLAASGLEEILPPALFRINDYNIALLFMISCAFVAGKYGLLPGLVASLGSFITMNYYFTLPYHTLKILTVTDAINMILFMTAAILISVFTSKTRAYAESAGKRERATQLLFTLYRVASQSSSRRQAIENLQRHLEKMLNVDVGVFMPPTLNPDRIEPVAPTELSLSEYDVKALELCWRDAQTTGIASPYNPGTTWRFEPMVSSSGIIGVIAVRLRGKKRMDAWFGRLLTAIADQTANVLEHIELSSSMEATRLREEREKLRSMLLSSVSHDLKTPLAGIIGALSVHQTLANRLTPEKKNQLLESSLEEAQRLDSFITNILDMTRLESGNVTFRQEWIHVHYMINSVRKRLQHRLKNRTLTVTPVPDDLEVFADVAMTEQIFQNILDNACKYTPEGSPIDITCGVEEGKGFTCVIRDHGAGLPPEKMSQVFDKYARLHKQDSQVAGTGLGLAICKAVLEAQHGWITAANHPEGGAVFTFCLPQWRNQDLETPRKKLYAAHE